MSLLQPELSTPHSPSTASKIAGPALVAGAALVLVGAGLALGTQHSPAPVADPCAMPSGTRLADLEPHEADLVTRRLLVCNDYRFHRITLDEYRAAVTVIDKLFTPEPAPIPRPSIVWASSVRGFSSQYTTSSWAATQVLGPPNVYPNGGDNASAWASLGADDQDEWLEVGFDGKHRVSAVELYETFNPGAVDRVELITVSGRKLTVQVGFVAPIEDLQTSMKRIATTSCTSEPIVAVRVHVASTKVAGWNEIDAIGIVPCGRQ